MLTERKAPCLEFLEFAIVRDDRENLACSPTFLHNASITARIDVIQMREIDIVSMMSIPCQLHVQGSAAVAPTVANFATPA